MTQTERRGSQLHVATLRASAISVNESLYGLVHEAVHVSPSVLGADGEDQRDPDQFKLLLSFVIGPHHHFEVVDCVAT